MKAGVLVCLALVSWSSMQAVAQSASSGVYLDVSYEAWSNGVPVTNLEGDWSTGYERRDGGQRAYVVGRVEAGASLGWPAMGASPWRLGLLGRVDAGARVSGQAAQVLYHYQSRTDPPQPVTYNADTDLLFWAGRGLSLHTAAWQWGAVQASASWDHMTLSRLRGLRTRGQVSFNADGSYGFHGTLRDDNARAQAVFMVPPEGSGVGDALSLTLAWRRAMAGDTLPAGLPDRITLHVDDAWSRLRWAGVNGNDAVLDSNVSQRTPEGYIEYRAAINGQYTRRPLIERIPVSTQLRLAWGGDGGEWSIQIKQRLGLWQRWLGWQRAGNWGWQVAVEPVAGAVLLGAHWQGWRLSVMADRLDAAAHAQGAQVAWAVGF